MTRRHIDVDERRARLGLRHRLADPAADPLEAATSMVALHSSDPATVYLAAWARSGAMASEDLDRALYLDRSLIRVHAMRRTMWVVPTSNAPLFHAAAGRDVATRERTRLLKMASTAVDGDVDHWFDRARTGVIEHLRSHEFAYADEMRRAIPELDVRIDYQAGTFGLGPRVLFQLAIEGDIVRTAPRGSWRSSVYAWTTRDRWITQDLDEWEAESARARLVHMWLKTFGPGTFDDLVWWTGWGKRATRQALASCDAVEVDLDGGTGFVAPGDDEPAPPVARWVALLPGLDPTIMGWKHRDWYLGEHGPALFDRNGNAGPTVWVDGRVVGGWAQRSDGAVMVEFLEQVDGDTAAEVARRADLLAAWLEGHVVIPRFRTPLESGLTR